MTTLKAPIDLETTFDTYRLTSLLGEGGAGRVYGGQDSAGTSIAVKVLTSTSGDKRRRFKNEIAFLSRNRHENIVTVLDHGVGTDAALKGPFYVMGRYNGSLRALLTPGLAPDHAMRIFSQILDGVEAAHLQEVTHRDLKPENILTDGKGTKVAVADFGVARFSEEQLHTLVQTAPATRLANFQYAAPEQRTPGQRVTLTADIYALGLMLHELFTRVVPHGTGYQPIASVTGAFAFLDPIVTAMIQHRPSERPQSVAAVKELIQRHRAEFVSLQKLREFDKVVIPEGEVSDPLAYHPPQITSVEWDNGTLTIRLDKPVNQNWVYALHNMGGYTSSMEAPPQAFNFRGSTGTVHVPHHVAQSVINYFKQWLPVVSRVLKSNLEQQAQQERQERLERLRREREAEERRLAVNRSLTF